MYLRVLYAGAAAAAALAGASAASAQTPESWTGFYVGGNLGVAWPSDSFSNLATSGGGTVVIPPADINAISNGGAIYSSSSGLTGGVEGGYNYQAGHYVFGVETDFDALETRQSATKNFQSGLAIAPPIQAQINERLKTTWMWTMRPRIGYADGPWLVYLTGGFAVTNPNLTIKYADTLNSADTATSASSNSRYGGIVGAGAAWRFMPNWSLKGEYLYSMFGNLNTTAASPDGFLRLSTQGTVNTNVFRMGVDYQF
jgi:outer membrane immunogenic protein